MTLPNANKAVGTYEDSRLPNESGVADDGAEAVEHLGLVLGGLQVADVAAQVALTIHADYVDETELRPREHQYAAAGSMLDQVGAWGTALRSLRLGDDLSRVHRAFRVRASSRHRILSLSAGPRDGEPPSVT
ncbi:hypothetical protein ACIBSV_36495 [Embleya sp. NPDC050154]|uniref:hypothetical protein n=1 Tax=Embleya sp. NPDC050154 TaxID=3363988 RepID=UPI0037ACF1D5